MTNALEPLLANLDRQECEGGELPLTLRRFRESMGVISTITAMQVAVAGVLGRYGELVSRPAARISASTLCRACGVALDGKLPRKVKNGPVYSAYRNVTRETLHSGAIHLDPRLPKIRLPPDLDYATARVAVGHELGHFLIHRRGDTLDVETVRLPTSDEEEALSEYAARLLLLPLNGSHGDYDATNLAALSLRMAQSADVTMYSSAARLGDPDSPWRDVVQAVILWRLHPDSLASTPTAERLTPQWHLSPSAFIPVKRCHAGRQSLVAELGSAGEGTLSGSRTEDVSIGSFKGNYRVDAVAWGSIRRGTRLVLSVFCLPSATDPRVIQPPVLNGSLPFKAL